MELDALDDRALVARSQEGSRDAFSALVTRYQERVLNLVYRGLGDQDAALDVAQEVFLKAYRGLARFQGDSQFFTWLFRITMNETITARRRRDRHPRALSLGREDKDGERHSDPPDTTYEPGAEAARHDDQAALHRAIAQLDDEQAQVLLLRDIDGRSYQEIAAVLDIPLGSVKSKIHRARLALKDRLARSAAGRGEPAARSAAVSGGAPA
ncbi:MAG: sigma-70 family RNA polymerase sigma factor [Planctomycetes bacterium]|nr:sigma-70 family RNA polymerase sigma factor [Planctomycetota bacterium]